MQQSIINSIKEIAGQFVSKESGVPEEKKDEAIQTTATSMVDGFSQYLKPENISMLTSLLGGGTAAKSGSSGMLQGVESKVASALTSNVGLSEGIAKTIASSVVPAVISMFTKRANDDSEPGFNVGSLIESFTGNGQSGSGGMLKNLVGGFFGKK